MSCEDFVSLSYNNEMHLLVFNVLLKFKLKMYTKHAVPVHGQPLWTTPGLSESFEVDSWVVKVSSQRWAGGTAKRQRQQPLGGSGGMLPRKIFTFRCSEMLFSPLSRLFSQQKEKTETLWEVKVTKKQHFKTHQKCFLDFKMLSQNFPETHVCRGTNNSIPLWEKFFNNLVKHNCFILWINLSPIKVQPVEKKSISLTCFIIQYNTLLTSPHRGFLVTIITDTS